MPKLVIVPSAETPAVEEPVVLEPLPYEEFVRQVGVENVGELRLSERDDMKEVKARVRRAAVRVGIEPNIWDVSGNVYFKVPGAKSRRISRMA